MKRILSITCIIIILLTNKVEAKAYDYASEWLAKKQAKQQEYLKELEEDGNLTQEAIDSAKIETKKKPNNKKETKKENKKTESTTNAKGWVYSTDELHIVGLPENSETGYTKAGDYGKIEK